MKMTRCVITVLAVILTLSMLVSCGSTKSSGVRDDALNINESYPKNEAEKNWSDAVGNMPVSSPTTDSVTTSGENTFASKIIKTVNMNTETKEFDRAVAELDRLISENGGFIEAASSNGQSLYHADIYRRTAKYTIRIPADRLSTFLTASEQLLNVTYSDTSSQNVTTAYYDIQSRLEVLKSEREALSAMLDKAGTVKDMLDIRDRLYNVIEEIESYETQLRLYDSLVSYSTIHMTMDEVIEYTEIRDGQPGWGERLGEAFRESWQNFAEGFQDFTVSLLYAIPTLLVIAVIGGGAAAILLVIIRKQRRIRAEQRAAWQEKHKPPQTQDDTTQK